MKRLAAALLLVACQQSPADESERLPMTVTAAASGAPSRADCDALKPYFTKGRPTSVPTKLLAACLVFVCANSSACGPLPGPVPPGGAGGSVGVGGSSGNGGTAGAAGAVAGEREQRACSNLAKLGCPEGSDQIKCASDMTLRCANPKVKCATDCLITATSKTQLQTTCHLACGGL